MKKLFLVALTSTLCACATTLPGDPVKMSPEQIKALSTDKAAQAACTTGTGPWGAFRTIFAQWDKGSAAGGTLTVTSDCQLSLTTEQKAPAASAPAAPAFSAPR